ncbi:hypothetical protein LTR56_027537 [Elasticomyces elasticus]|nr:hypothetical protein LTR22_027933 [Elasticomyces elasticus]KAK3614012.1 hypothetical protein LTR56_027537 [Elasticomyces elasticus]KAK4900147.1 hypothetical protein LTR49_027525 [Elasticomyces elasticus]
MHRWNLPRADGWPDADDTGQLGEDTISSKQRYEVTCCIALHKVPAFFGGNLDEKEQLVLEEGHDVDVLFNTDFESGAEGAVARGKEYNVELEKNKEPIANHEAVVKERKAAEEHEIDAEITLSNAEI